MLFIHHAHEIRLSCDITQDHEEAYKIQTREGSWAVVGPHDLRYVETPPFLCVSAYICVFLHILFC